MLQNRFVVGGPHYKNIIVFGKNSRGEDVGQIYKEMTTICPHFQQFVILLPTEVLPGEKTLLFRVTGLLDADPTVVHDFRLGRRNGAIEFCDGTVVAWRQYGVRMQTFLVALPSTLIEGSNLWAKQGRWVQRSDLAGVELVDELISEVLPGDPSIV
jgi:hypothetical protein